MRRTNIYLTDVQQKSFRRLSAATGQSMAALVRSAVNYMLAYPQHFPDLQGVATKGRGRSPATTTAGKTDTEAVEALNTPATAATKTAIEVTTTTQGVPTKART